MNLTKIQLEKIRIYLGEIGFTYVDVQMEVLDHVASAVEEKMTDDPTLSFEDAVNQTRAAFGKRGFAQIERSMVKGLSRKYWKFFLHHFGSFFGIKYIWAIFLSVLGLYQLQSLMANQNSFFTLFILVFILFFSILAYKSIKSTAYRKYMVYKISGNYAGYVGVFLMVVFQAINKPFTGTLFGLDKAYLMVSILIPLFVIYYIAALKTAKIGVIESKAIADKLQFL